MIEQLEFPLYGKHNRQKGISVEICYENERHLVVHGAECPPVYGKNPRTKEFVLQHWPRSWSLYGGYGRYTQQLRDRDYEAG